jgi:HEPN domain-containing protein
MEAVSTWRQWLDLSEENLRTAEHLFKEESRRACISRSYYAAFAAAHAALIYAGYEPPAHGNWPNPRLPAILEDALARREVRPQRAVVKQLAEDLRRCWQARLRADYSARATIDQSMARGSVTTARRLVYFARRKAQ